MTMSFRVAPEKVPFQRCFARIWANYNGPEISDIWQGSLNYIPILEEYDSFRGFALQNALFGLLR